MKHESAEYKRIFALAGVATVAIAGLTLFSFPQAMKEQAIHKRGCRCELCGCNLTHDTIYAHHILPKSMGGSNKEANLLLVCDPCHQQADNKAINEGVLANNRSVDELNPGASRLIANRTLFELTTRRFRHILKRLN